MRFQKTAVIQVILSLFWGALFQRIFRQLLNIIQPFYDPALNISATAYILIFIGWLSFVFFFHYHVRFRKRGIPFILFVLAVIIVFWYLHKQSPFPVELREPWYGIGLWLLIYLSFMSRLPFLIRNRISLGGGFLLGFLPLWTHVEPSALFLAVGLFSLIPNRWMTSEVTRRKIGGEYQKSQPLFSLRLTIDFLRFLSLGFSFLGILDSSRSQGILILTLVFLGIFMARFLIKVDHKKHHIRFGYVLLGILFSFFGAMAYFIPLQIVSAGMFGSLTVWEALYFRKTSDGYLRREHILVSVLLVFLVLIHWIDLSWSALLIILLIAGVQVFFFFYASRKMRPIITSLFLMGSVFWGVLAFQQSGKTLLSSFLRPVRAPMRSGAIPLTAIRFLGGTPKPERIISNVYTAEFLQAFYEKEAPEFISLSVPATRLNARLRALMAKRSSRRSLLLLNLNQWKPYRSGEGERFLRSQLSKIQVETCILLIQEKYEACDGKKLPPKLSRLRPDEFLRVAKFLQQTGHPDEALSMMEQAEAEGFLPSWVLREAARLAGRTGNIKAQIRFTEKLLARGEKISLEEKRNLMELFYSAGELQKSLQVVNELLLTDQTRHLAYLKWKARILTRIGNRYMVEAFERSLRYEKEVSEQGDIRDLRVELIEWLKQHPDVYSIIREEQERWEKIRFPE